MANMFEQLVASRREWIDNTLRPWCKTAKLHELRQAEQEWTDIAGRADPDATLWTWAWQRFPELVHEGLPGVNETLQVRVTLNDGRSFTGFPDGRRSKRGELLLVSSQDGDASQPPEFGPFPIDDVRSVEVASTGI